ncbi:autotransporter domain-containing protein [Lysobacter sp. TY2-98]|uniref:autotransporter domain-containing protein n=1 Tax=Lysobacter sp. TY2-98 TaxID=2290922 RepID=UPI000E1FEFB5|nr:autotransporter domain-containing protein [Lysobacter sp. TY2-98]AXK71312.1 autotransporter domain-containing protein [Lysobacter sp. TY2-98]
MKPVRTALAAALALAAMPAFAQTYSQTIFFGDSLTDTGAFRPALVAQAGPSAAIAGRFTTNPALIWSEYLADFYGTSANPYYQYGLPNTSTALTTNASGTDFAIGGARVATDTPNPFAPTAPPAIAPRVASLQTQVNTYLANNGGRADPNALFTVWGGANDIFGAVGTPATAAATTTAAANAQVAIVNQLSNAGARYILVATVPDIGATPSFRAQGAAAQGNGTALSNLYNTTLFNGLASGNANVIPLDTFHLLSEVIANPAQFGITNTTGTACQPQITAQSLTCNPTTYVNVNAPYTYLFADGVHPSLAGHQIMGNYAVSILEAPRQIQLLTHTTSVINRSRAEIVGGEAMARSMVEGDAMHWWVNARGDFQRYGKGDVYDGQGPSLTGGVDWKSGNLVYGAFGGFGRSSFDWGQRGGEFDQHDATLGGYVAWHSGAAWVDGQLSYTRTNYDTDRHVQLGVAERIHRGGTNGNTLTIGAEGGWEFGTGAFKHGPVVGVLSQHIDIDGFAEDQPKLSTSLAYPDQSFDSLIGKLGWQAHYDGGAVTPYARLTVDKEFEDQPEQAFARSQSLGTTGDYAVPGVELDDTYSTLTFGVRTKMFGLDTNVGSSLTAMQKGGNDASVFLTVGGGF